VQAHGKNHASVHSGEKAETALRLDYGTQLRQKISDIDQLVVENPPGDIQQTKNLGISHGIENVLTFFAADYDIALAENSELLRQSGLLDLQLGAQFVNADFADSKGVQDLDS
jgi:hypothetical protein